MPKFRITAPDGKTFDVEGPEGSTAEQALAQVQAQYGNAPAAEPQEPSTAMDALKTFGDLAVPGAPAARLMGALGSGAYGAGGKVTDILAGSQDEFGNQLPPEGAAAIGTGVNVGINALPMVAGGSMAKAAGTAFQEGARKLMQSAIKPTLGQMERGQGPKAVETALQEGISVSKGGMEKLRDLIEPLDKSIRQKISSSAAEIPLSDFSRAFGEVGQSARYAPPSESNTISKVLSDFADKFYPGGGKLPVQDIQKIKQAYYHSLGPESYGLLASGEREGMKAVAKGAKEAVANAVPGVAAENAQLGPLLNALDVMERRVALAPNRDVGGLAWLAHGLKTGILMLMARDPYTKSLLARGLYSGSEQIPATAARLGITGAEMAQGQQP